MKKNPNQIEFLDIRRSQPRPAGGGQVINGYFVFNHTPQSPAHVAFTIGKTTKHIYNLLDEGEFPHRIDASASSAGRASYEIPRSDVIEFIEVRQGRY